MMKGQQIVYDWPETGRLTVDVVGNHSATLQFFPSEEVIAGVLNNPKFCHSQDFNSQALNSSQTPEKSILGHFSESQVGKEDEKV